MQTQNMLTQESPTFERVDQVEPAEGIKCEGSRLNATYFQFCVTFPMAGNAPSVELSDSELLVAAEKAGTFDFLNSPAEDACHDLLKKQE